MQHGYTQSGNNELIKLSTRLNDCEVGYRIKTARERKKMSSKGWGVVASAQDGRSKQAHANGRITFHTAGQLDGPHQADKVAYKGNVKEGEVESAMSD